MGISVKQDRSRLKKDEPRTAGQLCHDFVGACASNVEISPPFFYLE